MEQLSWIQQVDEKEVRKTVAKALKQYKALRIAEQNKKELEEQGIACLFPSLSKDNKQNNIVYNQIQRAMTFALDETEREIIEKKYLGATRVNDLTIYLDMGLTKDQYYIYKKQAIAQIATALRII